MNHRRRHILTALAVLLLLPAGADAEDGYDLWLRYTRIDDEAVRTACERHAPAIVVPSASPAARAIVDELHRGRRGMLGRPVSPAASVDADGAIVVGTPATSPIVAGLGLDEALAWAGDEGYVIRSADVNGHRATVVAANSEAGA